MDLWFTEEHTKNVKFSIKVDKHIYSKQSEFQRIDIFETYEFGKILALDGILMITEKDEFIYHEMIAHTPMAVNPSTKNVLVVGGGDGGTVRELCKYEQIEQIHLVEIDKDVVEACNEHIPLTACKLNDPRVLIFYEDGLRFVRKKADYYDLIIVDSTDPFGPGEGLFTREFYGSCFNALNENGIMVNQHESPFFSKDADAMRRAHQRIKQVFPISLVYQAHMPTYPSGHWLFGFASKALNPISNLNDTIWNSYNIKTKYYNTKLHLGSFALPNYVKEDLDNIG